MVGGASCGASCDGWWVMSPRSSPSPNPDPDPDPDRNSPLALPGLYMNDFFEPVEPKTLMPEPDMLLNSVCERYLISLGGDVRGGRWARGVMGEVNDGRG